MPTTALACAAGSRGSRGRQSPVADFSLSRRVSAEFVGTALLAAAVVGSGIMAEQLAAGNAAIALLANTIATGAVLVALILAFGPISGAHFNPAVSVAAASQGELAAAGGSGLCDGPVRRERRRGDQCARDVWNGAAHPVPARPLWRRPGAQRGRRDIRTALCDLGMFTDAKQPGRLRGRRVHHGRVLVYRVHVVCEPGDYRRPRPDGHVCWNSSG